MRTLKERDKLVLEYLHLADKAARRASRFKIPYDEAYSIALLSLIKAAEKWENKSAFSTFYYRVSFNDLMMELRERRMQLPVDIGDGNFEVVTESRIDERIDARASLRRIRAKALSLQHGKKGKRSKEMASKIPAFVDAILQDCLINEASKKAGIAKCTGVRMMWVLAKAA